MQPAFLYPQSDSLTSIGASFRDPSGFIFHHDGVLYRWVSQSYCDDYTALVQTGLLQSLQDEQLLIPHEEVSLALPVPEQPFRILKPAEIPFVSYPHEWSFTQLKDAALLTLKITLRALEKGLILKDASAYNVQFIDGNPIFIDTLSFERYQEGSTWVAYKQFCQHFLAPLLLMSKVDISLGKMLGTFIDGIPLEVASRILPFSTRFNLGILLHIHLHAKSQKKYSDKALTSSQKTLKMHKTALLGLLDGLHSTIKKLHWKPDGTEWADYYSSTNYTDESMGEKAKLVRELLTLSKPNSVWDLGANTGIFSHIAGELGAQTVSFDIDPAAVERHVLYIKNKKLKGILPLVLDLTNPTGGYGWAGTERSSVADRGPADTIMALALIHHLAISNNVPLSKIAEYFRSLGNYLIIEFVPKSDSQVKKLLQTRADIFPHYVESDFEAAFSSHYSIIKKEKIGGSERTLYLMRSFGPAQQA